MSKQDFVLENVEVVGVRVESIRKVGLEDVYCLASKNNGTMIANGIITRQCDALRYLIFTCFPDGVLEGERDQWTAEKWKREIKGYDPMELLHGNL